MAGFPNYFADGMAAAEMGRANAFRTVAGRAIAASPDQRNALLNQAAVIDPNSTLALDRTLRANEDDLTTKAAGAARYMLNAVETGKPEAVAGAWQAVRPYLERMGAPQGVVPPKDFDPVTMTPKLHEILARAGGTTGGGGVHSGFVGEDGFVYNRMRDGSIVSTGVKADPRTVLRDHPGMPPQLIDQRMGTVRPIAGEGGAPIPARPSEAQVAADQARARAEVESVYAPATAGAVENARIGAQIRNSDAVAAADARRAGAVTAAETSARAETERATARETKLRDAREGIALLDRAEALLENATGSLVGSAYDRVVGAFGGTTEGAEATSALQPIAGQLVGTVPRFEGPQSNADVALYRQMAGDLANDQLPRDRRLAALREMRRLRMKYLTDQGESPSAQRAPAAAGGGRQVVKRGTHNGRRVVQYSDGSIEYGD